MLAQILATGPENDKVGDKIRAQQSAAPAASMPDCMANLLVWCLPGGYNGQEVCQKEKGMGVRTQRYTVEEFDRLVMLPENADKRLEFVDGEVSDVVSNSYSSEVAARLLIRVGVFVESKKLGRLTGADGGYIVSGQRYIPDLAFTSQARRAQPSHEPNNPAAPDLAVEVLSPSDDPARLRLKIAGYLAAATTVWIVDTIQKHVEIYVPGMPPRLLHADQVLDGGDVLTGFRMPVQEIFPD